MKNLIRKVLKEQIEWFENEEFELSPAEQFLYNKFMDCKLEPIKNKDWLGWTRYVDKTGKILFIDNIKVDDGGRFKKLYYDYDEIYEKLKEMSLNDNYIKTLIKNMLYKTIGLEVDILTPFFANSYKITSDHD